MSSSAIGIVAIGRNEGERLLRCLQSLAPHAVPIVYVDSASTDGSADNAARMGASVLPLDMARPFTAARARAEGFDLLLAQHPATVLVMFVDGDCEVEQGWLADAGRFMQANPTYAAICGRRRERFPEASFYNRLADEEWNTPVGEAQACGGDSMIRVNAYRNVGGFDPRVIAGEEPELCSRLRGAGWRIMRLDAPMTIHDAAMTRFGQWWRRAIRSGFGYAQAWDVTRSNGDALYRRELTRCLVWAGLLPLIAIIGGVLIHAALLLIWPSLTAAQFLRLAAKGGMGRAALAVSGKYAELIGAARYFLRKLRGETGGTIVYK